jgi:predicted MFS family arabinose efflux permease
MTMMLLVFGSLSLSGVLERVIGPRRTLSAATVASVLAWLLLVAVHAHPWEIYLASGLIGSGNGMALAAMPILVTSAVRQDQTGVANGINTVMRTVGGAVGAQVVATLIAHDTIRNLPSEHAYELSFLTGAIALAMALVASRAVPRPYSVAPV